MEVEMFKLEDFIEQLVADDRDRDLVITFVRTLVAGDLDHLGERPWLMAIARSAGDDH
jgi:hypothetical protein